MKENYYTLEEISLKIKTPVAYLRKMIKQERLVAHCMGRSYKVTETDLQKYIDSCGVRHVRRRVSEVRILLGTPFRIKML